MSHCPENLTPRRNLGVDCICNVKDERADILVLAWLAHHPDRHNLPHHLSHSEAKNSFPGYSNPKLDSLLHQAAIEQADAIRASK